MDQLQLREKEVFETLKKIKTHRFVVIGGYAVNAYTLPRFSVDCDIVIENNLEAKKIEKSLKKSGYKKEENNAAASYYGNFARYGKAVIRNFRVSFDLMISNVVDRNTKASFSSKWVFENSEIRLLRGKTISEDLKLRIVNLDTLIVMKFASCRNTDIRDIFMLIPQAKDISWIKEEVSKRYDFKDRFNKVKDKITSAKFKDNLQGVYGYIDKNLFEKHKKGVLDMN